MSTVRWGFLGAGRHPRLWVAPAVVHAANAEPTAVWSRQPASARQLAGENDVPHVHESLDAFLADPAVDAVFVATPNSLHASHVIAALQAGKHVLVEKPMATSVEDARAMVRAARTAGRILGVGFHFRHHALLAEAQRRIAAGALGAITQVTAQFNLASSPPPRLTIAHTAWKRDPEQMGGAGALMGMGVHLIDLLRFLTSQEVTAVQALASGMTPEAPLEPMGQALLEFGGGAQGHIFYGGRFPLSRNDVVVYGATGRIVAKDVIDVSTHGVLHISHPDGATGWRGETLRPELTDHYQCEIEAFSAAVLGGTPFTATGDDGLRVVEVASAIIESGRSGRRVKIEPTEV
ncbi:MAG: Gfo/Idh/MocA family oxidoreductase [Chloroflexi bacterium]|nr:Gfo/Idh/MocA family oxidoreductase [Chloroflexota bacterium]